MIFLIWSKHIVSFSRYLDFFYVYDESTNFKIYDVITDITGHYTFNCFFRILSSTKIKLDIY